MYHLSIVNDLRGLYLAPKKHLTRKTTEMTILNCIDLSLKFERRVIKNTRIRTTIS